jgi:predicted DNA binding CopG/RHH family protein
MALMGSGEAFVQCRVTPAMKTRLRALAAREEITESALLRQLLEVTLRAPVNDGLPKVEALERVSREARVNIRLAADDRLLLSERAAARGMAAATYVSVLVRSHLRNVAPLPRDELLALKRSVAELSAIGRNLNQIARAAHQGRQVALPGRPEVAAMLRVAEGLRDHVKALLKANQVSWKLGYAETTH